MKRDAFDDRRSIVSSGSHLLRCRALEQACELFHLFRGDAERAGWKVTVARRKSRLQHAEWGFDKLDLHLGSQCFGTLMKCG